MDAFQRVRRTGVDGVLHVNYTRQALRILHHLRYIHHPGDVGAATAYEGPDPGFLAGLQFLLRGILAWLHLRAPRRAYPTQSRRGGPAGLGDRVGDILGPGEGPADVDARPIRLDGVERLAQTEPPMVQAHPCSQSHGLPRGFHAHAQDHQTEALLAEISFLRLIAHQDILGTRVLLQGGDPTAGINDPLLPAPPEIGLEALAEGPHVHHEHLALHVGDVLLGQHGLLGRVHAAHGAAIVMLLIAGAHTLEEGDPAGLPPVGRAGDVPPCRTRSGQQALKLHSRHHIGIATEAQLLRGGGIKQAVARGQDDRPHSQILLPGCLLMVDGPRLAGHHALVAFRAEPTLQATSSLSPSRLFRQAQLNLAEVPKPILHRGVGHSLSRGQVHLTPSHPGLDLLLAEFSHRERKRLPRGQQRLASQVSIDGKSSSTARCDSLDQSARPGGGIASREDPRPVGRHGLWIHGQGPPGGDLKAMILLQERDLRRLCHGGHHRVAGDHELRPPDGDGATAPIGAGLPQLHSHASHADNAAAIREDLHRLGQELQLHSLSFSLVHLPIVSWHLRAGSAIGQNHLVAAQAKGRAGAVYRGIAAAHHHHPLAQSRLASQAHLPEEGNAVEHPLRILAWYAQLLWLMGTDGQEDSVVAIGEKSIHIPHGCAQAQIHPQPEDLLYLPLEHLPGQSVRGYAHSHHPAGHG